MKWNDKTVTGIQFEDIDHNDYPDYCDSHITEAEIDGREATESEIEEMNEDADFKYEALTINYGFHIKVAAKFMD